MQAECIVLFANTHIAYSALSVGSLAFLEVKPVCLCTGAVDMFVWVAVMGGMLPLTAIHESLPTAIAAGVPREQDCSACTTQSLRHTCGHSSVLCVLWLS